MTELAFKMEDAMPYDSIVTNKVNKIMSRSYNVNSHNKHIRSLYI